jgi:hypothetical protein
VREHRPDRVERAGEIDVDHVPAMPGRACPLIS